MSGSPRLDRRQFLRTSGTVGVSLGSLLGLGFDLRAARAETSRFKMAHTHEVPSVCPYCAVGCGQLVSVREGKIVNIEGNPDSPISRGTLCPKGAATYQLAVNEYRVKRVWYRAPGATEWDKTRTLEWAMDRIAEKVKATRDATFRTSFKDHPELRKDPAYRLVPQKDDKGQEVNKVFNHTLAIASLGGATMDNEWNYAQTKLLRALGVVSIENQARI
jgi:formate dehydrogenase major subunit